MLKHIWSILCRRSTIDTDTNNISLSEVFERLDVDYVHKEENMGKMPTFNIPIEYEVVSMWQRMEDGIDIKALVEVEIYSPSNKLIKSFPHDIEVASSYKRFRSRLKITGIEVGESGNYTFRVKIKENKNKSFVTVAEIPLEVNLNRKNE